MTAVQLQEWLIFSELEQWDATRQDKRVASVVQAILNVNRKKGSPPVKLKDVTLLFGDAANQQKMTWQETKAFAKQMMKEDEERARKTKKRSSKVVLPKKPQLRKGRK